MDWQPKQATNKRADRFTLDCLPYGPDDVPKLEKPFTEKVLPPIDHFTDFQSPHRFGTIATRHKA